MFAGYGGNPIGRVPTCSQPTTNLPLEAITPIPLVDKTHFCIPFTDMSEIHN